MSRSKTKATKSKTKTASQTGPKGAASPTGRRLLQVGGVLAVASILIGATMLSSGPIATKFNAGNSGVGFEITKTTPLPSGISGTRAYLGMEGNITEVNINGNQTPSGIPLLDARGNLSRFNIIGNSGQ
jgi:hypothetical protein